MSFSLAYVRCARVTHAIALINDIGQQVHWSFASKGEIMADLKGRINRSNTDTIIGLKHCFQFPSKYYGGQSNMQYAEEPLNTMFTNLLFTNAITLPVHELPNTWRKNTFSG